MKRTNDNVFAKNWKKIRSRSNWKPESLQEQSDIRKKVILWKD